MSDEQPAHASSPVIDPALRVKLAWMFAGNYITQLIYVAAKLGIPDLLAAGALDAGEIASRCGADRFALTGMLRALVALEVLSEDPDERFALQPLGALLKSFPGWRSQAILLGEEYFRTSGDLMHTALTGEPSFDKNFGASFYEYFARNDGAGARFNQVMMMSAPLRYADVVRKFDFSRARLVVDVGGGHGGLTALILKANPEARAILFDSPSVIPGAKSQIEAQGLSARCDCVAGDFFQSVPGDGDVYLLSSVIANWDDQRASTILRSCRAAMPESAHLVMVDYAFLAGSDYAPTTLVSAVAALAIQGTRMRSESDYRAMLPGAGFSIERITPLAYEPYVLIHARPV